MSEPRDTYDLVVVGAGPAGQKAAIQGAKGGWRVLVIERESSAGGECVHRGTIPSKTLRESAVYLAGLARRSDGVLGGKVGPETMVKSLMGRLETVLENHERYMGGQLERNGVELRQGRASFLSPTEIEITGLGGRKERVEARHVVVATGSRPRKPPEIAIDHEHVLDSDSILSMIYLPTSLTVLGAGVIASEFATIFLSLGVRVTIVDRGERPLAFLDNELKDGFLEAFEALGGAYVPNARISEVECDGLGSVDVRLEDGQVVTSEKVLCALGRTASLRGMNVEAAGIETTDRGFLKVDANCQSNVPRIYGAGDVIGPPALATSSMDQGRRAVRHAQGLDLGADPLTLPVGIYTIPELACVGLTEDQARAEYGEILVGHARFNEVARGHINGAADGFLKIVTDGTGSEILGAHILGEGATELIHLAQMGMIGGLSIDSFVDNIFNFPTMAEAYRVAALDVTEQRFCRLRAAG